jgi:regulator of vacuolar morphogenesis
MAPPLEISIPTTSLHTPADGSKLYTLYNITLRLPLRSFVVQKRYSDFAALHQALLTLVGSPPPSPLPAKSWFRSTVSSPELTEQRRAGLERYLRAIAEPPDRRWRDTPAWRAFLNLPSASGASVSGVSVEGRIPAIGLRDANLAAASDPATWVDLNKEMKTELGAARTGRCARRKRRRGGRL